MKTLILFITMSIALVISGCQPVLEPFYTDNEPIVLEMRNEQLKILQLTDNHLTYGIDYNDRQTYKAIEDLVRSDDWDLVVFTGDMVMSPFAIPLFRHLVRVMETLEVPWTFILGNHDRDYHTAERLLSVTQGTQYLYFKVGPELEDGGAGNFKITFTHNGEPFYHLYFLDSKSENDHPDQVTKYDFFSPAQVAWFDEFVAQDTVENLVFFHTPLQQFEQDQAITGTRGEPSHPQGLDTGFFDTAVKHGLTRGMFVGHDHDNDFSFTLEGIVLAYGRYTGYNAYGYMEIGGRIIEIAANKELSTRILSLSEVRP